MESDTSVKVAVRIRPLLEHERSQQCSTCVVVGSDQNFTFDYVYSMHRRQEEVMEECVMPLVDALFEGFNATILAYGQTGSGKTYTMGSASSKRLPGEMLGIIPRSIQAMFDMISEREDRDHNSTFRIRVQFLEIYGEEIRDLLDPSSSSKVSIRETAGGSVYVSGAREELVTSTEESMMALEKGSACRMTASTRMNETSSRSHGIFTVILEQTLHSRGAEPHASAGPEDDQDDESKAPLELVPLGGPGENEHRLRSSLVSQTVDFNASRTEPEVRKCKFHFVDLAGSERVKRTGAEGLRLREGIDINKGLLVLGNVISALGDEQKRGKVHVPYRDSKLTRMLQDSLGGNSKTLMICCVSPADSNYYESLNALKYANRARNIQNKPRVNIDPTVQVLRELRKHVQCLATEALLWRALQGVDAPPTATNLVSEHVVPFSISGEMLRSLASSGGGTTNLLLSSNVAPVAIARPTPTKSPPAGKNVRTYGSGNTLYSQNGHNNINSSPAPALSMPNSMAMETLAARKLALEHEATIFSLKQKLSDAESEVHRLTETARRHRQIASDVAESNSLLQSERDFYKLKLWDAGMSPLPAEGNSSADVFREDFVSEQPASIGLDSEEYKKSSNIVAEACPTKEKKDTHVVVSLLARYVREIDALKEILSLQRSFTQHRGNNMNANVFSDGALDFNTLTSTIVGMDTNEPSGESIFDSNVAMMENDLTSSVARVISQTQIELHNEQQRLYNLKAFSSESHVGDGTDILMGLGATNDGNDDQREDEDSAPGREVEAEDRAFRRRQQDMSSEVVGLSNSIQLKEQLLLQLQRSQRQYEMMKLFYEKKLISLSEEVNQTEAEKLKVSAELEQLAMKADRTLDKEEALKVKLREKDSELRLLHKKQNELTHHSQIQSRSLNQIVKLESEIEHMKRSRVDLTKKIHAEKKKHLAALNVKAREIEKLKAELNKTSAEIKKVSREKDRAENRTREALKEGADLRRKVHEISKVNPAFTSDTASSTARLNKKNSVKSFTTGVGGWNSNTSYRPASKRLLSEEEVKTKRYLDKALQNISERERAADALRQQYEQQLALMNQKKQLETSRSTIRELITANTTTEGLSEEASMGRSSMKPLTPAEEDALQEVEERIQNLEGQLLSRKVRIQSMQTELAQNGKKGSSDSTVEYLQKKSADSLPAAHELLRLLFDMLVSSKVSIKNLSDQVEKLKEKERNMKEQLEDGSARIQSLQFAHDQELTRLHSDYEEKLSGLLNFSDVNQLLTEVDSKVDVGHAPEAEVSAADSVSPSEHNDRKYSRLLHAVTAEILSFDDHCRPIDSYMRARSDSGNVSNIDVGSSYPEVPNSKGGRGKVRALLALSHEKNIFLSNALSREYQKVSQLQTDLEEIELARKQLVSQLENKEFERCFLNEECRMLRDLVEEYKERVLLLEGGQGVNIVRTIDELDKQKRGEKGMVVRYGDNPDSDDSNDDSGCEKRRPAAEADRSDDSDVDNSEDFGVITDEILKSGSVGPSAEGSSTNSNVSIFDRLANPSYFTGTQKKLFQKDLESKRALVKKIKKDETVKKKNKDLRSLSDDETGGHFQKEKEDCFHKSDDEDGGDLDKSKKVLRRSSFSTDDLDIGTNREPQSPSVHSDFALRSGASFESTGASANSQSAPAQGGDVFSRLLNPTKFTGIHKTMGLSSHMTSGRSTSPAPGAPDVESPKSKGSKGKGSSSKNQRRGSGKQHQFHL